MLTTAIRWSGWALIIGVTLTGGGIAMVSATGLDLSAPWVDAMLLAGSLSLMLGWPGMYARQADAAGWLGLVGHALLAVGGVLLIVVAALPLLNPAIHGLGNSATAFFLGCSLLIGLALTAIATLRAGVYPRWAGALLLAASAGFLFTFFIAEYLPPIAQPLGGGVFGLLLAVAFIWIGVSIWMSGAPPEGDRVSSRR